MVMWRGSHGRSGCSPAAGGPRRGHGLYLCRLVEVVSRRLRRQVVGGRGVTVDPGPVCS